MRILWMSNSPWTPTGYGAQTRYMLPLLKGQGHEVACFDFYGLQGGNIEVEGIQHYANHVDAYGNDAVRGHMVDFKADALFTLFDPFVCNPNVYSEIGDRWYPWVPIDSKGMAHGMEVLHHARKIVAMSQHGERQLMEAGYDLRKVFTIPHGVNCDLHRNRTEAERFTLRRELGLPETAFVVGIVQANKGKRKALSAQIQAFAEFRRRNDAKDAHLYVHTEPTTVFDGFDLDEEVAKAGLKGLGVVHRTHTYAYRSGLSEAQMSRLMGSFDVLLQATIGEGFGIPIIEAQANGVPVLVNTGSAMDELVPTTDLVLSNPTPIPALHGGTHFYPNQSEIVERLTWLYKMSWDRVVDLRQECRSYVEERFSWPVVGKKWEAFNTVVQMDQAQIRHYPVSYDPLGKGSEVGGVIVGAADADSAELLTWIEQAPFDLVVCPPDRVEDCDFYLVWDEYDHDEEDLQRVGAKPNVLIRRGVVLSQDPTMINKARMVWFTDSLCADLYRYLHPSVQVAVGDLDAFWKESRLTEWLT